MFPLSLLRADQKILCTALNSGEILPIHDLMAVFWIAQISPFAPVDPTNSSLCGTAGCVLLLELFLIESAETYWCRYPAGIKTRTNIMDF